MDLSALQDMLARLRQAGGMIEIVEAKNTSLIEQVTRALNLDFPQSLRAFYGVYEYLQVGSNEFVWLGDMLETVQRIRSRYPRIPTHYLPVLSDDMGGYYYVICRERAQPAAEAYASVIYNPAGFPGLYEISYPDFLDLVAAMIQEEWDAIEQH